MKNALSPASLSERITIYYAQVVTFTFIVRLRIALWSDKMSIIYKLVILVCHDFNENITKYTSVMSRIIRTFFIHKYYLKNEIMSFILLTNI